MKQAIGLLISGLSALIISGLGTPIVWLILRIVGVTDPLIIWLGHYYGLMVVGGLLIGAILGIILSVLIARILEKSNMAAFITRLVGGAIGGYASSLMFFPIVVIL